MARADTTLTVIATIELTPRLRRIVLSGPGFDDYLQADIDASDKYVKLVFDGADGPVRRTYTVRHVDAERRELWIDFVTHGDHGVAGPWAMRAQPGDQLHINGPGGAYVPPDDVDHHLMVGDESALPAISASVARLPSGAKATVFLEVDSEAHELELVSDQAAELTVHWLHRAPEPPGTTTLLFDALRAWTWPGGRVSAFVHGESALLKTVRPWLLDGRVARGDISVSAYWRRGETEEGFRAWKREFGDAVLRPTETS